jgi:hypothetical protein
MKAKTLCFTFVAVMMFSMIPYGLSAKTLGMVADFEIPSVTVFDADTHVVLGTVFITSPPRSGVGDVLITRLGRLSVTH